MKFQVCWLLFLSVVGILSTYARPMKDSPISTIVIPYEPYTSQKITNHRGELKNVFVPLEMEIVPKANIAKGQLSMARKGSALNFAEGAYPVYYMPSNVNGKFNGKISLLVQ
ncbi:uncharacterized protein LOC133330551 [Musca vetustissima]|uniref:uncharacterized protein LOC133330551 n=1 Tax=Musca vetustissima TaxID=27455 RepID=UPI002AB771D0|nr:uncharacterized protein LOC133330551 [Musca vetustissima]